MTREDLEEFYEERSAILHDGLLLRKFMRYIKEHAQ